MPTFLPSTAWVLVLLGCCSSATDVHVRPGSQAAALDAATRAPRFELRPRIEGSRWTLDDPRVRTALHGLKSAATPARTTPSPRADALSLLAYLGSGNTLIRGPYQKEILRLVKGFRDHRDVESYQFLGTVASAHAPKDPMLDHLLASTGMCEAYYFSKSIILKGSAKGGLRFVTAALADEAALSQWSEAALLAALELAETARAAGLSWQWRDAIRVEVQRRTQRVVRSPGLLAAHLLVLPPGPERDAIAAKLATTVIGTLLVDVAPGELHAVWVNAESAAQLRWAADALHAVGGPDWIRFRTALESVLSAAPTQEPATDREALAAMTLVMEAGFRLK